MELYLTDPRIDKGINIDGIDIDMREDGTVVGMSIMHALGGSVGSITVQPKDSTKYWRLFLAPSDKNAVEKGARVKKERRERTVTLRFAAGENETKYLIAPGVQALVDNDEFHALEIDLNTFVR